MGGEFRVEQEQERDWRRSNKYGSVSVSVSEINTNSKVLNELIPKTSQNPGTHEARQPAPAPVLTHAQPQLARVLGYFELLRGVLLILPSPSLDARGGSANLVLAQTLTYLFSI